MDAPLPFRLLAIVGERRQLEYVVEVAADVPEVGIGIMLRDSRHNPARVRELADHALRMLCPGNVTLISNSTSIDGIPFIHLTSTQLQQLWKGGEGRSSVDKPFGASVHSGHEALNAEVSGAAYGVLSPIFPTSSKPGAPGIGIDELRMTCTGRGIPLFALGGIDEQNVSRCLRAGAYGIAGISLFQPENREGLQRAISELRRFLSDTNPRYTP